MGAVVFVSVIRLRRRWRSALGTAVLIGLIGALALVSIAGGRTTQRSFDEYLGSVRSSTMSVTTFGNYDAATNASIAALPGVARSRTYVGFNLEVPVGGRPDFAQAFEGVGTFDGRYFDQDRFTATSGRLSDPTRVDEVVVNEFAAEQYGYRVGQQLVLAVYSTAQRLDPTFLTDPPAPKRTQSVTIVGVGVFPDEALHDDGDRTEQMLITPALSKTVAAEATYGAQGLVLSRGAAGVGAVRAEIAASRPAGSVEFHTTADDAVHARRALRPLSITITLFGLLVGAIGLVLGAQALARMHRAEHTEQGLLRAFGADQRTTALASLVPLALVAAVGIALAELLAALASPLMPIGPVRRLQAGHGVDLDVPVLAGGAAIMVAVFGVVLAFIVVTESAERLSRRRRRPVRGSRLSIVAASSGLPATAVIGVESAFGSRAGSNGVPNRSVIVGAALGVGAVIAALTFGASLDVLVHTPRMYGWDWDATVLDGNGYDNIDVDAARAVLAADPLVAAWSGAYFGTLTIGGIDVSVLGMAPDSTVVPPIVQGRMIRSADEIVLGAATAVAIGARIGGRVEIVDESGATRDLSVVGLAIFPAIGRVHTEHTSLGTGAIVVPDLVPGHEIDILGNPGTNLGPNVVFVRYAPHTSAATELAHLHQTTAPLAGFAGLDVLRARRPAEIVNSDSVGNAPLIVAATLAIGAVISLALALGASVRRRNRDLAVLAALGFTRRQLAATVAWHATSTIVAGLLVGIPVGIVAGRELWLRFAERLHVVPDATVSGVRVVVLAVVALVVANVVAAVPARAARSVQPSALSQETE
ncbi:MAG: hypothetical protein JWL72_4894 [Ilumatobacteraceae bacterium]|nr:hypothetical protein [Ilumatobacteraceae bacterium]